MIQVRKIQIRLKIVILRGAGAVPCAGALGRWGWRGRGHRVRVRWHRQARNRHTRRRARYFLRVPLRKLTFGSDAAGQSAHPDLILYPEFIKLDSAPGTEDVGSLSAMQITICKRVRRTSVDKEGRSLKVGSHTEAKALAGAIASCTREGARVELTSIGAGSVNQAIKAIAIARQYVEEEAIDLCCRPEFVEIGDGEMAGGEGASHGGGGGATSALRIIVLVEQT